MNKKQNKKAACHPDRPHFSKGLCKICYHVQYAKSHREQYRESTSLWRERNSDKQKERSKNYRRTLRRHISIEEYKTLLLVQEYKCAICHLPEPVEKKDLAVDHDHATGIIRGLLCSRCNLALGLFRDSVSSLESAIHYLTRSK